MTAETALSNDSRPARVKVFISYSRRDIAFVDILETALTARNFETLVDRTEIYAFEDWWKRIEALIARADTVVFVLSPDSIGSDVARKEVLFAASLNKRFAPIVFRAVDDKAVPETLAKLNLGYHNIGNLLVRQDKLDEALKSYRDGLVIARRLVAADRSNTQWQSDLLIGTGALGILAYKFLLSRAFATALESTDQAIALSPETLWFQAVRSHALMFLGRADEARTTYLRYRGQQRVDGDKSWDAVVLGDFVELRQAGLTHPLMDEIESLFDPRN